MLLPFIDIPLGIALSVLFIGQQRLSHLLPVLANGWHPVLAGAQLVLGTWGQFVLLLVLLPLTEQPGRAGRASLWALGMLTVMALGHNLRPSMAGTILGSGARRRALSGTAARRPAPRRSSA